MLSINMSKTKNGKVLILPGLDMKKKLISLTVISIGVMLTASAQRKQSFDEGWRFHRGATINAETVNYDDSKWREVIVPHDFSM